MAKIVFQPQLLATLKERVVVLTGGATGIGKSAVEMFTSMILPEILRGT